IEVLKRNDLSAGPGFRQTYHLGDMATGKDNHEALRLRVTWGKSCNRESLRPGLSLVIAQLCYGPALLWASFAMAQFCYGSVALSAVNGVATNAVRQICTRAVA
ncbi:MAG: hypothetical protein ACPHOE_13705, partial [Pseudomonadales bacterium]